MTSISVAVVGASGYGGAEIVRLLATHPVAKVTTVTSGRSAGKTLQSQCAWLATDLVLTEFNPATIEADVVFLCQESGFAMRSVEPLLQKTRVIDLSADFRLKDFDAYQTYYKADHVAQHVDGVYGLPELVDIDLLREARLVANPGCYPTSALLGLMPLVKAGLVSGTPIIDSKSGVSGAGRSRTETDYLFTELDGGFKSYASVGHRHTPEIEQMVGQPVRFTPHLLPLARGIHSTIHVPISEASNLTERYREFYSGRAFVQIVDAPPSTKQVLGSNRCDIFVTHDPRTGHAVILSVLDNLVKGAAGQAIQNMNLMFGLEETLGLPRNGVWP